MERVPVSALVLTYNEEKHVARSLGSIAWADEVVVIDAYSTDQTKAIVTDRSRPWAHRLKFIEHAWTGFKDQREFALTAAAHDWVFVLDADEACTPELHARIEQLLSQPGGPPQKAYKVLRREYFLGKPIRFGVWNPSYQARFFHRDGIRYINNVHEFPVFADPPGAIDELILHTQDLDMHRFVEKMNEYTSIEARDRYARGKRTNWFHLLFAFPSVFWKSFFYRRGYRDGMHGFVVSVLEGISRALRHVKLWAIQHQRDGSPWS